MMLTLTIKQNNREAFDIQVPSEQKIGDTIQVLYENNLIDMAQDIKESIVWSVRKNIQLNLEYSYEQNSVYTADILKIC